MDILLRIVICARPMTALRTSSCRFQSYLTIILLLACCRVYGDEPSIRNRAKHHIPWKHEIISPHRINSRGSPIHWTRHFQKRSVTQFESGGSKDGFHEPGEEAVIYSLDAFGQNFRINLGMDHSFISPSFRLDVNSHGVLNESAFESLKHCFFSGSVNDHKDSFAVVSLCGGMSGIFQIGNSSQFLIEPVKAHRDQDISEESLQKDHIISTYNPNYKPGSSSQSSLSSSSSSSESSPSSPSSSMETGGTCGIVDEDTEKIMRRPASFSSQFDSLKESINKKITASKTDANDSNKVRRRKKRFQSYEHFLELMVVADYKMVEHHGDNVQHYILTLISMVDRIFRDPSIGNSINVVLVQRVILLPKVEPGLDISSSSTSTLRSFCAWQKRQNEPNGHPHHYDTAILLTRENICRSDRVCDTLGLAELGTICDPDRSCSIVEDNGLSAAFTMAHEMGHVFNLPHDDASKCDSYSNGSNHVMAPTLNHSSKPWDWSNCSRHFLTSFLEAGHGHCLWNKPNDTQVLPSYLPGEVYNATKQCKIVFGENSRLCPFTDYKSCSLLWCTAHRARDSTGAGCYTHQMPQANGTPCELNKGTAAWCIRRKCVTRTPNAVEIHGGWGKWQPFGTCSRTCGGGVQQSRRECNSPIPENGGRYCIGDRIRFRSCHLESCPEGSKDFREEQCASFNADGTEWVAKFSGVHDNDVCKLFCQKKDQPASFQQKSSQVIDGTSCKRQGDDICVQGQCKRAGCDHRLGSDTVRDNCYICGGDNSTCSLHQGHYNQQKWGYSEVVSIPVDATKFVITQRSHNGVPGDDNFLALRVPNGRYFLNGDFVVSTSLRQIKMAGVVITYSGSDQIVESITSDGKFNETVQVEILSVGKSINRPDIAYSFYYPLEGTAVFDWVSGPWEQCSHHCEGRKSRSLKCVRRGDNTEVSTSRCTAPPPERISKKCNNKCYLSWVDHAHSECSSRCGRGLQQFDVRCYKTMKKTGRQKIEPDHRCNGTIKPPRIRECRGSCPVARWEYSEWTACSKACNNGTRVRQAVCRDAFGRELNESKCTERKHDRESCNTNTCPQWRVSAYSSCSVTCGRGEMVRTVMCYQDEIRVSNDQCAISAKPDNTRPCEISRCPTWQHASWSECSVTCGSGVKIRSARCFQDGVQTSSDSCNPATKPVDEQTCTMPPCSAVISLGARTFSGQWRMGSWTACSTTCGPGIKERYVTCTNLDGDPTDENTCDPVLRPPSREVCEVGPCTHWETGSWQDCSSTCGRGVQHRRVNCRHEDGQYLSEEECSMEEKPPNTQQCKIRSCKRKQRRWKKQRWSEVG